MKKQLLITLTITLLVIPLFYAKCQRRTIVEIRGEEFYINGKPTYEGRYWNGLKIQGLLLNSRMVQGIFDDMNPGTIKTWAYHDTGKWDPERNTKEFVGNMKKWRQSGLLSFTINMQGGSPQGYSQSQPWYNSAYFEDGSLRPEYLSRLKKILDEADRLGMVPILGLFYFGQDERLADEKAVVNAVKRITDWLFEMDYRNVIIEINNECNIRYDHDILKPARVHELIDMVKTSVKNGRRFYAGTSYGGGTVPMPNVVKSSDFILMHGNGVREPARILEMIRQTRETEGYTPKPILFNEDDHYDFEKPQNNFLSALNGYASWGFFDYRREGESYEEGYQSVPVDWSINSGRKRKFFSLVKQISGE